MPEIKPDSVADRTRHTLGDVHMRKDASLILMPRDLTEGAGNFIELNKDNNPLAADGSALFKIGRTENSTGWAPYVGTAPQGVDGPTRQVASDYDISRNGWLGNQPLIQGALPPGPLAAAKLPRPLAPLLVAEPVGIEGYAASPETSPLFVAITFIVNGKHSLISPFTLVPPLENGQCIRVHLYEEIPAGVTHVGVWLTVPGSSTPSNPGAAWLQREIAVEHHNPVFYDLTGPFRHEKAEPTRNETTIAPPSTAPQLSFNNSTGICRPGAYVQRSVWVNGRGETLPGPQSPPLEIQKVRPVEDDEGNWVAERGRLYAQRPPNPPTDATGWRPYIYTRGEWHVLYDTFWGRGNEQPWPLEITSIAFGGFESTTDVVITNSEAKTSTNYTANETILLVKRDLPTENTTPISDPADALEEPTVFGVVRLPAGSYYAQVTESLRGRESVPSPTSSITINDNEVLRVIRRDRVSLIANPVNSEVGANGLPFDRTIVTTGGSVTLVREPGLAAEPLIMLLTNGAQAGTTPSSTTRAIDVDRTEYYRLAVRLLAHLPPTGAIAGTADVVLEELDSAGSVTQTVIGTLSAPGGLVARKAIYPAGSTGVPGTAMAWQTTTIRARILVRFGGASKNMTIKVGYIHVWPGKHTPRRFWRLSGLLSSPDQPEGSIQLPPGTDVGIIPPLAVPAPYEPAQGGSPALVAWEPPDRPVASGVLQELKHDFESAMPTGWTQNTSGATLTREVGTSLIGNGYLRCYKAS